MDVSMITFFTHFFFLFLIPASPSGNSLIAADAGVAVVFLPVS
jgi:hypothetical protein